MQIADCNHQQKTFTLSRQDTFLLKSKSKSFYHSFSGRLLLVAVAYINHLVLLVLLNPFSIWLDPAPFLHMRGKGCKTNSLSCCRCLMNSGSQFVAARLPCLLVQCWLACNVVLLLPCANTSLPAMWLVVLQAWLQF